MSQKARGGDLVRFVASQLRQLARSKVLLNLGILTSLLHTCLVVAFGGPQDIRCGLGCFAFPAFLVCIHERDLTWDAQ